MVFSSVPVYLDPPNWHQQPNQQQGVASNENPHHQLIPPLPPPPPSAAPGSAGSIRPGSIADRARLAKLPQPETALKCPRCDSTNTKFCYFNNYSLSQPRHFCKTCRRYWTKGGALRNVPVGGGCRRNKKSKSQNSSKSSASSDRQMGINSTSTSPNNAMNNPSEMIPHLPHHQQTTITQLPFLASLQNLTHQFGVGSNIGLGFGGGGSVQGEMGFHHQLGGGGGVVQHQFPFFEQQSTGLFPYQTDQGNTVDDGAASRVSQIAPVKTEVNTNNNNTNNSNSNSNNNNQGGGLNNLSSSRPFFGVSDHHHHHHHHQQSNQYSWGGNTWTDLSGLNSSSTTHLL